MGGVDVQTEAYAIDPAAGFGELKTGMEGYAYFHGYSSFQSNLGTMSFDGAESSTNYRTNIILHEVGGASSRNVVISAYMHGSFVPGRRPSRSGSRRGLLLQRALRERSSA